jgi:integrase
VASVQNVPFRVGEALALTEKDIDADGYAHIGRTKTDTSVRVRLPDLCRDLLRDAPRTNSNRLFGYAFLQAASVALRRTCERAGVPYFSFHKCGRHYFASWHLRRGKSTKWVQIAGGWKSAKSMDRYLHLEHSEVMDALIEDQAEWSRKRKI